MLNRVSDFIKKHQLLSPDGLHIVALSGGADSVALLHVLIRLGYHVEAAHCNFHLRGEESNRDELFVKNLCEKLSVKLHLIHFNSAEYAKLHKVSIEMAARDLRYGYFYQLCRDISAETVCVAHHRDDAVETFLMNLLRGSGIHGLTGIRPKNGPIVRPLLGVGRQDILNYLDVIGQNYVTDSTNLVDDVLRNKIRLNIIPLLNEINPQAVANIDKSAGFLREIEKIFNKEYQCQHVGIIHTDSAGFQSLFISDLLELPSPESFLHEWLADFGFNSTQVEQLLMCLHGVSGKLFYSKTHVLAVDRVKLLLEPLQKPMKTLKIPETGRYRYSENISLDVKISDKIVISNSDDYITLDAGKVKFPLIVRPVKKGDVFCPFGMKGKKLVSDFMTDRKFSILEKRRQLVLTDVDDQIMWLVGIRIDNRYRIESGTSLILRLKVVNTV